MIEEEYGGFPGWSVIFDYLDNHPKLLNRNEAGRRSVQSPVVNSFCLWSRSEEELQAQERNFPCRCRWSRGNPRRSIFPPHHHEPRPRPALTEADVLRIRPDL